jgi:hypothetical protein
MLGNGLIEDVVLRVWTFSEVKLEICNRATTALVHCYLFRCVVFG